MDTERVKIAQRVTWHGFFINLLLSIGKIVIGILGNSAAMIADGIHSLSDFVTDLIVIVFVRISGEE
ncbi:MAG: cation transporter, partial [Fibrobacter sp.]|nr:cation transporter [Fibrobacter sp.]